jgi:hypothetical protein
MTRKAKFGDTVSGWGCKYRHAVLGHEYVLVAPTRTALIAILNAGTEPLQVWRKDWLKRAQVVKAKSPTGRRP